MYPKGSPPSNFLAEDLDLSYTFFTNGPIPGEAFVGLDSLSFIDLSGNAYATTLPHELVTSPELKYLNLVDVRFENLNFTLDFIAEMPRITECWVDDTPVSGGIPSAMGDALSLVSFSATSCGLDGKLPTEMGNLIFLEKLWLYDNHLTGTIPSDFGNLGRLGQFFTDGNKLSGSMPAEVCELSTPTNVIKIGADCDTGDNNAVVCPCCTCCGPDECENLP